MAIVISILALILGGVNFYWAFLRNRKVLHLVYVKDLNNPLRPGFAIVNGGKSDLLITNLSCSFGIKEEIGGSFTPAQSIEFKESGSLLLPSGKAFHCKVTFIEPFTSSFAKRGMIEVLQKQNLFMHDMYVDISWIEMNGKAYDIHVKLVKYGFSEKGEFRSSQPVKSPINLYK